MNGATVKTMGAKVRRSVTRLLCAGCALLVSSSASGQCPVTVTRLRHSAVLHEVRIAYRNSSAKAISAVKFSVYFIDGVGDIHADPLSYLSNKRVKPGKEATEVWQEHLQEKVRLKVDLVKVMYGDGSVWAPTDGRFCSWSSR